MRTRPTDAIRTLPAPGGLRPDPPEEPAGSTAPRRSGSTSGSYRLPERLRPAIRPSRPSVLHFQRSSS